MIAIITIFTTLLAIMIILSLKFLWPLHTFGILTVINYALLKIAAI